MSKTILLTGATDGIGLETAKMLFAQGHCVLLHGRSESKLKHLLEALRTINAGGRCEGFLADLSDMAQTDKLARDIADQYSSLDVLINNAGIFSTPETRTRDNLDVRFAVNTLAPYLLTKRLLPRIKADGRIVNLSSAAQANVDLKALAGDEHLSDGTAYAQSKLALTMWSFNLAQTLGEHSPSVIAVNPGSMLGSKMVKDAYGVQGGDIRIGAEILCRAALDKSFENANGRYFDNDTGRFAAPHADALDAQKCQQLINQLNQVLTALGKTFDS